MRRSEEAGGKSERSRQSAIWAEEEERGERKGEVSEERRGKGGKEWGGKTRRRGGLSGGA